MDRYLGDALEALKAGETNRGLSDLVMALQEMSGRLDAIEHEVGVEYEGDQPNQ